MQIARYNCEGAAKCGRHHSAAAVLSLPLLSHADHLYQLSEQHARLPAAVRHTPAEAHADEEPGDGNSAGNTDLLPPQVSSRKINNKLFAEYESGF